VFETEDGAQERKIMGGTQRVSDCMYKEVQGWWLESRCRSLSITRGEVYSPPPSFFLYSGNCRKHLFPTSSIHNNLLLIHPYHLFCLSILTDCVRLNQAVVAVSTDEKQTVITCASGDTFQVCHTLYLLDPFNLCLVTLF
jgi:hypothetical protein